MSSEKRAESCLKISQSSQKRFVQIRVIRGKGFAILRTLREKILSGYESFYIFVAEFRNKLKKGGNGKQSNYNLDLVF
mgnify:FL=1